MRRAASGPYVASDDGACRTHVWARCEQLEALQSAMRVARTPLYRTFASVDVFSPCVCSLLGACAGLLRGGGVRVGRICAVCNVAETLAAPLGLEGKLSGCYGGCLVPSRFSMLSLSDSVHRPTAGVPPPTLSEVAGVNTPVGRARPVPSSTPPEGARPPRELEREAAPASLSTAIYAFLLPFLLCSQMPPGAPANAVSDAGSTAPTRALAAASVAAGSDLAALVCGRLREPVGRSIAFASDGCGSTEIDVQGASTASEAAIRRRGRSGYRPRPC